MMEAVLKQHLGTAFRVESAGVREELAGRPANHRSVSCMKERGVDLSVHVSRWVGGLDLDQYEWIVCVGHDEAAEVCSLPRAKRTRVIVANEHQGGIPDPYELGLAGYRACLALLDEVMPHVARHISQAQSANPD
jgi:protein-tyrosine-phosphatase